MSTSKSPHDLRCALAMFNGSETFTRWSVLHPDCFLTDGTLFLADNAECYWLMDAIASWQHNPKVKAEEFQVWSLFPVGAPHDPSVHLHWLLKCEDGNGHEVVSQSIQFTDFPLHEGTTLWVQRSVIGNATLMLPSEY